MGPSGCSGTADGTGGQNTGPSFAGNILSVSKPQIRNVGAGSGNSDSSVPTETSKAIFS